MPTFLFLKLQERKHSKAYLYSSSFNLSKSRDNFHVLNQCYRQYSSSIFVQGTFLESSYVDAKPLYEAQPFNAKSFGCGSFHIALISKDNLLYLFGENRKGQCGIDPEKNKNIESPICPVQNIPFERVYCGRDSTYAIPMTNNRIVYACGFNDKRQLGLGINESILYKMTPLKEFEAPIRDIRTSAGACWFLLENGKILNCGGNNFNELGTNDFCIQSVPLEPKFLVDFIGEKISDVRSGLSHSAVLTESGKLYTV